MGKSVDRFERVHFSCTLLSVEKTSHRLGQDILEVVRRQCCWLAYHLALFRERTSTIMALSNVAIFAAQSDSIARYRGCTLDVSQRSARKEIIFSDRIDLSCA
jgi:hypothetical protein